MRMAARFWLCLMLCLIAAGCATVPHTGRRQFNMVSDADLNSLGLKAYREVVQNAPLAKDKRLNEIVARVAQRVSQAAESLDKPKFDWEVKLVDKDVPNAVCLPGGKVIVFTGILPYAQNEAGLAAIVGHEIAHAVARHGGERLSQKLALESVVGLSGELLRGKDGKLDQRARIILGALGLGGEIGVILPYSRIHELEADRIGQIYMAHAGYDPAEYVNLWQRMAKIKKPPIPVWLSTHPTDEERIAKLKENLPNALKVYEQASPRHGIGSAL
ncbi:MAG: M48 family metallopeptidase [Desulfomonilaceae bacterium]